MNYLYRLLKLVWGLFLFAIGVVVSMNAKIGLSPWDVLHTGLASKIHIPVGESIIAVGLVIVIVVAILNEPLGLGTLANMILVGTFVQIILGYNVIPVNTEGSFIIGVLMLFVGTLLIAYGTFRYVKAGFGAGPRDSLMVIIARKTGWKMGTCRYVVEGFALVAGFLMGGLAGVGTAFSIVFIAIAVQVIFKVMKFEPSEVDHENFKDTAKLVQYHLHHLRIKGRARFK